MTAPTVYYYFKNKEALFEAVQRETITMSGFIARLSEECAKAKGPKAQLHAFTRTYLSYFPKDRLNVGLYVRHSTELDSVGRKSLQTELIRLQTMLTKLVRRGVDSGDFRKTDPAMAAECLLGMMNRFVFQQIHFRRSYKPAEAATYLSDFFFQAMKPANKKKR